MVFGAPSRRASARFGGTPRPLRDEPGEIEAAPGATTGSGRPASIAPRTTWAKAARHGAAAIRPLLSCSSSSARFSGCACSSSPLEFRLRSLVLALPANVPAMLRACAVPLESRRNAALGTSPIGHCRDPGVGETGRLSRSAQARRHPSTCREQHPKTRAEPEFLNSLSHMRTLPIELEPCLRRVKAVFFSRSGVGPTGRLRMLWPGPWPCAKVETIAAEGEPR